jgi:hypothetical protein
LNGFPGAPFPGMDGGFFLFPQEKITKFFPFTFSYFSLVNVIDYHGEVL